MEPLTTTEKVAIKADQPSTYASISGFLAGLMVLIPNVPHSWADAANPEFLGALGATLAGLVGMFKKHPKT